MVIEQISISNYKGIKNLVLQPKKLTAIVGKIGCGKSSILEAIRFGVTGVADTPQKNAEIVMKVLGGKEISRKIVSGNKSVKLERRKTTQENVKKFLELNAGLNMECSKVTTSAKLLANMNSGSLCEFLINSGLIPLSMTFSNMVALCGIDPLVAKALSEYLPQTAPFSLTDVETAYREVYDSRTALNREISIMNAQAHFDGEKPSRTASSIDHELSEILGAEERQHTYELLKEKYEKDIQNQKRIRREIQDIESQIKTMRVSEPDASEKQRLQEEQASLQSQTKALIQTIAALSNAIAVETKALQDLSSPVCPLSQKLECRTDKTSVRADIEKSLAELQAEQTKAKEQKESLESRQDKIAAELAEMDRQTEAFLQLKSLYNTRKALMDSMPVISEPPVPPENIENLAAKKSALQAEKNRADAYTRSVMAKRRLADLQRKLGTLEKMLVVLSPKSGLREKIIANVLAPLEKHCNELASKLRLGFELSIQVKNGVTILCKPKASADFVSLTDVSTGEQTLAIFLILDMLNQLSGLGLLMMDNLDALDAEALDELMAVLTLQEVLDRYDHIFISMVSHDDSIAVLQKYCSNIDQLVDV